ncbi:DoxX family protein [Sulfitobacter donghicola]|uniref:DoxX n=1 Tax=Sulfitobacter donghicola DSW-25 = KCTC 12864 = JCM 14565 TaxID=1300350 RepID=A0A073IJM0_9RHOB|nr:DoxX family protein [Sulfitobacter donghicola]KEJ89959.1 DoxX [Sulfitobacter donghicola DSW-25 = KCTC 12864 = JCM 14565]KIN66912.1 DoxX subfamily protein [Sulfitobacter donghicola DSW-25 = KCTC 12864 = JCM 14565]
MTALLNLYRSVTDMLEKADWLLPTLARFLFAAILLMYFWVSGLTKIGEGFFGIFSPSTGAYVQIFPRMMEAVGYDTDQFSFFHGIFVLAGTWAEFILPALIVLGLFTRLAALGMIGFVALQSLTDLYGHNGWEDPSVIGGWFDRIPDGIILDQRAFWVFALLVLVIKGAGPISFDRALSKRT